MVSMERYWKQRSRRLRSGTRTRRPSTSISTSRSKGANRSGSNAGSSVCPILTFARGEEPFGHHQRAGRGVDEAVALVLDVGGLRVHVAREGARPQLALELADGRRARGRLRRAAVVREAEAAPLAHDQRHLPAVEERVADDQRVDGHALHLAPRQLVEELAPAFE